MPRKIGTKTDAEQGERFRKEAKKLAGAGELRPNVADDLLHKLTKASAKKALPEA